MWPYKAFLLKLLVGGTAQPEVTYGDISNFLSCKSVNVIYDK